MTLTTCNKPSLSASRSSTFSLAHQIFPSNRIQSHLINSTTWSLADPLSSLGKLPTLGRHMSRPCLNLLQRSSKLLTLSEAHIGRHSSSRTLSLSPENLDTLSSLCRIFNCLKCWLQLPSPASQPPIYHQQTNSQPPHICHGPMAKANQLLCCQHFVKKFKSDLALITKILDHPMISRCCSIANLISQDHTWSPPTMLMTGTQILLVSGGTSNVPSNIHVCVTKTKSNNNIRINCIAVTAVFCKQPHIHIPTPSLLLIMDNVAKHGSSKGPKSHCRGKP